ncbi:MAG: sigma-70 family RNA polymerase sigma factor [Nitrospirota bacterium]|nr:sigma-70 family RNA polymerase sigma factor [Nitrospirota bacterium]MDP2381683.1 sigma-70 family RNA polymerase sigma factor [Nitrospirota bacterium]MDP3595604.1 sigma-70 family RNA polymerase sigma factor [Nitrospirota bacterium]
MTDQTLADSHSLIDVHGDFLYRFALVRVRNQDVAEDLVQETFLAALQGTFRESGPTAERRWMIGIMKHKIVDYFRRKIREPIQNPDQADHRAEDVVLDDVHWKPEAAAMQAWPEQPDGLIERRQFWDALAGCMERLPPRAAQVFTLRELDELETEQICELLQLTPTNFGVILHRARKQLRDCLSSRYFGQQQEGLNS